ncbi:hypothetical protein EVAR_45651_1 [Eumeta japonica]|uniref:Endonuclease-reverse transcriptase n=1 Tax=Eumeta variegata TaxID=151549 RepID=A0A4C1Y632_EUMVA|nr:hypothetical protein EVAR_45651_1 [Eumeta japonica]
MCKCSNLRLRLSADTAHEISRRIRSARRLCYRYRSLFRSQTLDRRLKFTVYKFFVRPLLTYGCEVWRLTRRAARRLWRFEIGVLVEIYKSKYPRRHPKRLRPDLRMVYASYDETDVVRHAQSERLRWGTLLRQEKNAIVFATKGKQCSVRFRDGAYMTKRTQ